MIIRITESKTSSIGRRENKKEKYPLRLGFGFNFKILLLVKKNLLPFLLKINCFFTLKSNLYEFNKQVNKIIKSD